MKKLVSYLITIMMVFTMIPSIAFAGSTENEELTVSYTWVNPEYEDVVSESDLQHGGEPVALFSSEIEYASTPEEAAAVVKEYMVNRVETFTLYYKIPATEVEQGGENWFGDLCDKIFPTAFNHTGNPCEGDYLKQTYGGYNIPSTSISVSGKYYYMPLPVEVKYYTTYDQEEELTIAVDKLLDEIIDDNMSDYEKIKAIYDYMTSNISYDYEHYGDNSYKLQFTGYAAMINGTSVCQGYANLFYRLALECGIDTRIITGTSVNNQGKTEGHAWNIVKLGSKYYNLDATWDSTWDADKTTHDFFLHGADSFDNHTRNAEYETAEFNAAYPMADSDYVPGADDEQGGSEGEEPEVCIHEKTEVIPAVAATCTETGLTEGLKCASCGEILTVQTETAMADHTYDNGVVTVEPTTTTEGVKTFTCTACGNTKTENIPVIEEKPGDDITEITDIWTDHIADSFAAGEGTETNPYIIETAEELALLAKYVNEKNSTYKAAYYELNNDIDLVGHNWMPIGTILGNNDGDFYGFEGCFDGKGHTISNMTIISDLGDYYYYGLFGMNLGTIKNVKLDNPIISFESIREGWQATNGMGSSLEIGAICGASINRGYIENCRVNNVTIEVLTAMRLCCGGAIGSASEVIVDNVLVSGDIKGTAATSIWMGGNIGSIGNYVFVENCGFEGTVSSENDGEIGFITEETEGCSYLNYVGGFCGDAGRANRDISIKNCYAIADIYSKSEEGMQDNGGFAGAVGLIYDKACYENLLCKSSITAVRGNETIIEKDFWQGETPFGIQEYCSEWNYKNCVAINGSEVVIRNRDKLVDTTDTYDLSKESITDILKAAGFDDKNWVFDGDDLPGLNEHSYGSWIIDKEATCTETGEKHRVCADCGYEKHVTIAKKQHYNEWVIDETKHYWGCKCGAIIGTEGEHTYDKQIVEPTCVKEGYTIYTCNVCVYSYTDDIVPATGHTYGEWVTDANNHWKECACGDIADKAVHEYEWIVDTPATEDADGSKHQECTVCGAKGETESIGKLEHVHAMVKKEAVAADCETEGNIEYYVCSKCDKLYADTEGKKEITKPDTIIGAVAHIFTEVITEPTCTEEGKAELVCIDCGKTILTNTVPALGHKLTKHVAEDPTCTTEGSIEYYTCDVCGKLFADAEGTSEITEEDTVIPATGHDCKKTVTKATTLKAGSIIETCKTCNKQLSKTTIPKIKETVFSKVQFVYDGTAKKPIVTVKNGNNIKLKSGTDFTVKYKNASNKVVAKPVAVGKYTAVVTFQGNYSGTINKQFTINPKATVINNLTRPAKKQIKLTWQKRTVQVTGYEIQYSTTKNFTKKTTTTLKVKNYKTNTKTIKNLKSNKKYWVKVRTYKNVNGKLYYSAWSKVRYITTK